MQGPGPRFMAPLVPGKAGPQRRRQIYKRDPVETRARALPRGRRLEKAIHNVIGINPSPRIIGQKWAQGEHQSRIRICEHLEKYHEETKK